jgi:hypothetical protein
MDGKEEGEKKFVCDEYGASEDQIGHGCVIGIELQDGEEVAMERIRKDVLDVLVGQAFDPVVKNSLEKCIGDPVLIPVLDEEGNAIENTFVVAFQILADEHPETGKPKVDFLAEVSKMTTKSPRTEAMVRECLRHDDYSNLLAAFEAAKKAFPKKKGKGVKGGKSAKGGGDEEKGGEGAAEQDIGEESRRELLLELKPFLDDIDLHQVLNCYVDNQFDEDRKNEVLIKRVCY